MSASLATIENQMFRERASQTFAHQCARRRKAQGCFAVEIHLQQSESQQL
ncbi:MAG: hypothetical protein ABI210_09005 [Abditibacteriaceae bacterium]